MNRIDLPIGTRVRFFVPHAGYITGRVCSRDEESGIVVADCETYGRIAVPAHFEALWETAQDGTPRAEHVDGGK